MKSINIIDQNTQTTASAEKINIEQEHKQEITQAFNKLDGAYSAILNELPTEEKEKIAFTDQEFDDDEELPLTNEDPYIIIHLDKKNTDQK